MSLSAAELEEAFQGSPSADIPHEAETVPGLLDVLVAVGMTKSKGEGRRLIQNRGVSVNEVKPDDPRMSLADFEPIEGYLFVIRKGNKGYFLARWGTPS